ncbi:hypothetical protein [Marinobacter sp.]|uniref:hypothetical protein n=1 Tax=Marinobacter sp. TaxID=50741 RepID=UPI00198EAFF1|nr:hypothetical protein [Marinobacter sp.]MBC7192181.1 hypothetical protein [Marinobacter sp.]
MAKIKSWFALPAMLLASALSFPVAADTQTSIKTLSQYMDYAMGPGAPADLRKGSMNMGAIMQHCYSAKTLEACQRILDSKGRSADANFLKTFQNILPKIKGFEEVRNKVSTGQITPYSPALKAVFAKRNCGSAMECSNLSREYFSALASLVAECPKGSDIPNTFMAQKSWTCVPLVKRVTDLSGKLNAIDIPLNDKGQQAIDTLSQSNASMVMQVFKEDGVYESCLQKSPQVDDDICSRATRLRSEIGAIESSIRSRGLSERGGIDLIEAKKKPYQSREMEEVQFNEKLSALNDISAEFLTFYVSRSEEISVRLREQKVYEKRMAEYDEQYKAAYTSFVNSLERAGLMMSNSISDVNQQVQDGAIRPTDVSQYLVDIRDPNLRLHNIEGSMLIFSDGARSPYRVALSENDSVNLVANGSLKTISGHVLGRIVETTVSQNESGRLVQMYEVSPYTSAEWQTLWKIIQAAPQR